LIKKKQKNQEKTIASCKYSTPYCVFLGLAHRKQIAFYCRVGDEVLSYILLLVKIASLWKRSFKLFIAVD
jgi:hypothetical protein